MRIEADLRELHPGAPRGRNRAQVLLEDPEALGQFWNDPYHLYPPEAEPVRIPLRACSAPSSACRPSWMVSACCWVTHGGVMRLLLARARNLLESQLLQVEVGYGALHGLQVEPGLQLTEV